MSDDLLPITFFIVLGLCVLIPLYLRYLTGIKKMNTLLKLAERGVEISADTVKLLSRDVGPIHDLRRGVIFIALSLPIIVGLIVGGRYQEAVIVGGIPLCIGLAYLIVLKVSADERRKQTQDSTVYTSEDSF